ncbi:MAG: hypothetical protein DMD78_19265 [Candidatus Rokuibacteriota bacterium]|nr:MAG: hypothetical protein DMD78_19265 [Candidatus Rokubacteria bacterium]
MSRRGRTLARRLLLALSVRALILLALLLAAGLAWAQAAQPAGDDVCIVLEDFSKSKVGAFPVGWEVRQDEGKSVYTVQEEGDKHFLRAVSKGLGIQAARETAEWNLQTHPILAWSWRPRQFPEGSNERDPKKNDSALAVYMGVPHSKVRGPKAVKYIWSQKVPAGTRLTSNKGLTQVRVLKSGAPQSKDAWVEEKVNVLKDWKAAFKASGTPKVGGIAVLTDADDTKSTASGDYANFRACRS